MFSRGCSVDCNLMTSTHGPTGHPRDFPAARAEASRTRSFVQLLKEQRPVKSRYTRKNMIGDYRQYRHSRTPSTGSQRFSSVPSTGDQSLSLGYSPQKFAPAMDPCPSLLYRRSDMPGNLLGAHHPIYPMLRKPPLLSLKSIGLRLNPGARSSLRLCPLCVHQLEAEGQDSPRN